eukprot:TRINITY_DN5033_c0_g1_i1.p1 TRINITY_DN5033_c0_g1~~TRINITY_DN5033_c0_g1_i1.p1  ORF type:complete len:1330 (+),score=232.94 TRINITY_DN5033_c0_g1_i1:49-4038(+)
MSWLQALHKDFQSISEESKRRFPVISKLAGDTALNLSQTEKKGLSHEEICEVLAKSDEMYSVIEQSVKSKHTPLLTASFNALQKLISQSGYNEERLPTIIKILQNTIQLEDEFSSYRVLQISLALINTYPRLYGECIHQICQICFLLNRSKSLNVHQSSSAVIRQIVCMVFDKIMTQIAQLPHTTGDELERKKNVLQHSVIFAASLLKDICKLIAVESGSSSSNGIHTSCFGFELLEESLRGRMSLFDKFEELQEVLNDSIVPILKQWFTVRLSFAIACRICRIASLFLQEYIALLSVDCGILLGHLATFLVPEKPDWQKALALEVLFKLSTSHNFIKFLFTQQSQLANHEKTLDDILQHVCQTARSSFHESFLLNAMPSSNEVKYLDILSEADPTDIPEAYNVGLSLRCFIGIMDEFSSLLSVYPPTREEWTAVHQLELERVSRLMEVTWDHLCSAFHYILSRIQDEEISQIILRSVQSCAIACDQLGLIPAKERLIDVVCSFSLPSGDADANSRNSALNQRNVIAAKTLLHTTNALGDHMGSMWKNVLVTFEHLDHIIYGTSQKDMTTSFKKAVDDLMLSSSLLDMFHGTKSLSDNALRQCVDALIFVSSESIKRKTQSVITVTNLRMFGLSGLVEVARCNAFRIQTIWTATINHFLEIAGNRNQILRMCAVEFYIHFIANIFSHEQGEGDDALSVSDASEAEGVGDATEEKVEELSLQENIEPDQSAEARECRLDPFTHQDMLLQSIQQMATVNLIDVSDRLLQFLHQILQLYGEKLSSAWHQVIDVIENLHSNKHLVSKSYRIAQYMCANFVRNLPEDCLDAFIDTVSSFIHQTDDSSISSGAVQSLWRLSKYFVSRMVDERQKSDSHSAADLQMQKLILKVYLKSLNASKDSRIDVRKTVISSLFENINLDGNLFPAPLWSNIIWQVIFPMAEAVETKSVKVNESPEENSKVSKLNPGHPRNSSNKQWDETRRLVIEEMIKLFEKNFKTVRNLDNFVNIWIELGNHVKLNAASSRIDVAQASIDNYPRLCSALLGTEQFDRQLWEVIWGIWTDYFKMPATEVTVRIEQYQHLVKSLQLVYSSMASKFVADDYLLLLSYIDNIVLDCIISISAPTSRIVQLQASLISLFDSLKDIPYSIWPTLVKLMGKYILSVIDAKPATEAQDRLPRTETSTMRTLGNARSFSHQCIEYVSKLLLQASPDIQGLYFEQICLVFAKLAANKPAKRLATETWNLAITCFIKVVRTGMESLDTSPDTTREDVWLDITKHLNTLLFATKYEPQSEQPEADDVMVQMVNCISNDILAHVRRENFTDTMQKSVSNYAAL